MTRWSSMQTPRRVVVLGKYVFQLGWKGRFPGTQSAKYSNLFVCSIKFTMLPSPDLTKNFIRDDGLKEGEMNPKCPKKPILRTFWANSFQSFLSFFSLGCKDICQFLTDLEFLLWNEVRNWFLTCSNFAQLMLVTTATTGGSVFFQRGVLRKHLFKKYSLIQ